MKISIAMATYNGEPFLSAQLDSLAGQHLLPAELHIGDDGSTDNTLDVINDFQKRSPFPVFLHQNKVNLGFGENFIRTAQRCSSAWIAFCDQDDVWLPEKLSRCADEISAGSSDVCLVVHNAVVVSETLEPQGALYSSTENVEHRRLSLNPDWLCFGFTQVFRKSLITAIPASARPLVWHRYSDAHDAWVALLANATGSIQFVGEPLALYRRHTSNSTAKAQRLSFWGRAHAALRSNAQSYAAQSGTMMNVASLLRDRAEGVNDPMLKAKLIDAASSITLYSSKLNLRAKMYQENAVYDRLKRLAGLYVQGGYVDSNGWPFGYRALAKDLALAFLLRNKAG